MATVDEQQGSQLGTTPTSTALDRPGTPAPSQLSSVPRSTALTTPVANGVSKRVGTPASGGSKGRAFQSAIAKVGQAFRTQEAPTESNELTGIREQMNAQKPMIDANANLANANADVARARANRLARRPSRPGRIGGPTMGDPRSPFASQPAGPIAGSQLSTATQERVAATQKANEAQPRPTAWSNKPTSRVMTPAESEAVFGRRNAEATTGQGSREVLVRGVSGAYGSGSSVTPTLAANRAQKQLASSAPSARSPQRPAATAAAPTPATPAVTATPTAAPTVTLPPTPTPRLQVTPAQPVDRGQPGFLASFPANKPAPTSVNVNAFRPGDSDGTDPNDIGGVPGTAMTPSPRRNVQSAAAPRPTFGGNLTRPVTGDQAQARTAAVKNAISGVPKMAKKLATGGYSPLAGKELVN